MKKEHKRIMKNVAIIGLCLIALLLPGLFFKRAPDVPAVAPSAGTQKIANEVAAKPSTITTPLESKKESQPFDDAVDSCEIKRAVVVRVVSGNRVILQKGDEHTGKRFEARIIGLKDSYANNEQGKWLKMQMEYYLLTQNIRYVEGEKKKPDQPIPVYIYFPGDDLFNEWAIYFGFGVYESDPENFAFEDRFIEADFRAKEEGNGLYSPEWSAWYSGKK